MRLLSLEALKLAVHGIGPILAPIAKKYGIHLEVSVEEYLALQKELADRLEFVTEECHTNGLVGHLPPGGTMMVYVSGVRFLISRTKPGQA